MSPSQIIVSFPALIIAAGSITSIKLSVAAGHEIEGVFVVILSVTVPFAISFASGVYTALGSFTFGAKVPVPLVVQRIVVAEPPKVA